MTDGGQLTHLVGEASRVLDVLTRPLRWTLDPRQLVADAAALVAAVEHAVTVLTTPPPGSPGELRALAAQYAATARAQERTATDLGSVRTGDLPDGMVGVAAGRTADALAALEDLAWTSATGARLVASALEDHADVLSAAQASHSAGRAQLDAALSTARSAAEFHEVLGVPVAPDVEGTLRQLAAAAEQAADGVRSCRRAYADALDGELRLRRRVDDGNGHALLADRPAPAGWTVLDVAVLSVQGAVQDPDDATLDDGAWTALLARLAALPADEREAATALLTGTDDALARAHLLEALARGHTLDQVAFLADRLGSDPKLAARIQELTTVQDLRFDQTDATTCGSTSLLRLVAQHDPLLSLWLLTGARAPGYTPGFLAGMPETEWQAADFETRLGLAEKRMQDTTGAYGWPDQIGTSPWDAERVLDDLHELTGRRYEGQWVDDQDHDRLREQLTAVARAANRGIPVPLYVGGELDPSDLTTVQEAIPRHVVLVTGYADGELEIYDPADGEVTFVDEAELLDGGGEPLDAFGNWEHPVWVGLPEEGR